MPQVISDINATMKVAVAIHLVYRALFAEDIAILFVESDNDSVELANVFCAFFISSC